MLLAKRKHNKRRSLILIAVLCVAVGCTLYLRNTPPPPVAIEPIAATTSTAAPAATPPTGEATPADRNAQTILELFSPSDPYLTRQLGETALKQQIEQIITSSFVLTKCNLIRDSDYRDNFSALIVYAQHMKLAPDAVTAEATVRQIAESASTSYALVYSRTKCDDPKLPTIATQLLAWQNAYLGNLY